MAAPEIMSVGFKDFLFPEMFRHMYIRNIKHLSSGISLAYTYHAPLSGILKAVVLGTYVVKQC